MILCSTISVAKELEVICEEYQYLHHYEEAVRLCLRCALALDPTQSALAWIRSGSPPDDLPAQVLLFSVSFFLSFSLSLSLCVYASVYLYDRFRAQYNEQHDCVCI